MQVLFCHPLLYKQEYELSMKGITKASLGSGKKGGRPKILTDAEEELTMSFLNAIRDGGGNITGAIVIATAVGVLQSLRPEDLKENGGHIEFSESYPYKMLDRVEWTWRMRTTGHRHLPEDVDEKKRRLDRAIVRLILEYNVPLELLINYDETGNLLVPLINHTFAPKGVQKVVIQGSEEKRAKTLTVGITAAGEKIPPQEIHPVKSSVTLPADLPAGWKATFRKDEKSLQKKKASHWANEGTHLEYIDQNLLPFVASVRERLGLPPTQKAIALADVFKAHLTNAVKAKLEHNNIILVTVPACAMDLF
jgi:hypothetical protein